MTYDNYTYWGKEKIADGYGGDGYDWNVFALFRDQAGRLYTARDAGCSCNSAWEYEPDFSPVDSVQEAIRRASDYFGDDPTSLDEFKKEALAL